MQALTVLLIAGLAIAAQALPSRIIGGENAPVGKYPYQVSLRYFGSHFCGGSIINKRYILTAAHCITSFGSRNNFVTVHAGTNLLNEAGDSYNVEEIISHEDFSRMLLTNDIGLLRVSEDIKFTSVVQPVKLAQTNFVKDGQKCIVSGWGTTRLGGNAPNKLQHLTLFVESQDSCAEAYWQIQDSHLCTFVKYGQGLCHGDSGGPLVTDGVQIGIVSFGQPCAVGVPDVFTRVSSFADWLSEHVKSD